MYDKTYWETRRKELATRIGQKKDKTINDIVNVLNEYFAEQSEVVKSLNEIAEHMKANSESEVEPVEPSETADEEAKPTRKKAASSK